MLNGILVGLLGVLMAAIPVIEPAVIHADDSALAATPASAVNRSIAALAGPVPLRLLGALVEGGAECPRFLAVDNQYYTLEGNLAGFHIGDAVEITGVIPSASHCMQDTTVRVTTIRRIPPPGNGNAMVSGRVTIGPLCPIEPCPTPHPDVYSSRMLVLQPATGRPVGIKLNPDGTFRAKVAAGTYELYVTNCVYLGCRYALPRTVTIEPHQETSLQIDIDTGIR